MRIMLHGKPAGDIRCLRTGYGGSISKSVQHFALAPNNLTDSPSWAIDFMKEVPTTWDEVRFIDGYPGKYVILARRHGDKWYIAGVNAQKETLQLKVNLPMFSNGEKVRLLVMIRYCRAV